MAPCARSARVTTTGRWPPDPKEERERVGAQPLDLKGRSSQVSTAAKGDGRGACWSTALSFSTSSSPPATKFQTGSGGEGRASICGVQASVSAMWRVGVSKMSSVTGQHR
eukprot:3458378-Prymnesium_polylepis.3